MLSPFLILFFVFTILPILSSVVLSFTTYDMISAPKFNGISNYIKMFSSDDMFPNVLRNTLVLAIITGPIGYILSFVLAWMINELNRTARTILSFLFYAPALSSNVYFIWQVLFSGDSYGYVNSALLSLGIVSEPIQWFKDANYVMVIIIVVQLWMSMGISFLSNISGLQNVNPEMYEAGCIDGIRNRWAELWYITLPSMKPILLFGAVMQIQSSFSIGAVVTALAGFPSVNYSVDTLVTLIQDVGTSRYEMGYAAALSVFLFAMMAVSRVIIGKVVDAVGR
ncbi:MAG: sugar ABC transporter permease [Ruminococcaceae bacterium]|nr:sugar ABC transporter permease [Oscillospiraceae bacterium]